MALHSPTLTNRSRSQGLLNPSTCIRGPSSIPVNQQTHLNHQQSLTEDLAAGPEQLYRFRDADVPPLVGNHPEKFLFWLCRWAAAKKPSNNLQASCAVHDVWLRVVLCTVQCVHPWREPTPHPSETGALEDASVVIESPNDVVSFR